MAIVRGNFINAVCDAEAISGDKNVTRSKIKKGLTRLAADFELEYLPEVILIIQNSTNYDSGQRELLKVYDRVYMGRQEIHCLRKNS